MRMTGPTIPSRSVLFAFAALLGALALGDAWAGVIYQERDGVVVGEGEIYSSRTHLFYAGVTNGWFVVPDEHAGAGTNSGARGGAYVQLLPDNNSPGAPNVPPEIRYQMQIFSPGTYRLYIRKDGNISDGGGGTSDSLFFDIVELKDGTNGVFGSSTNAIADWYESTGGVYGNFGTNIWSTTVQPEVNIAGVSGKTSDWVIPRAGIYSLRFTQREDGAALDAWVFQLTSLPAPTGYGPAMSALVPSRSAFQVVGDTFLRRDDGGGAPYGTNTELIVKNDSGSGPSALDRTVYLRFDISALSALKTMGMALTNASLSIDLIAEGIGTNHTIYVAAIAENATAEMFAESNLLASTSDVLSGSTDEAVNFSKVFGGAALGGFEISRSDQGKTLKFSGPELLKAIRADTNGVLSLVLYRTEDSPSGDTFASKEHATLHPALLVVDYWTPPPGTLIRLY